MIIIICHIAICENKVDEMQERTFLTLEWKSYAYNIYSEI